MLIDSIQLTDSGTISNATIASGPDLPISASTGELFFKTTNNKMYCYSDATWKSIVDGSSSIQTVLDPLLTLNGSQGTAGQAPISQGPGLPPVWGDVVASSGSGSGYSGSANLDLSSGSATLTSSSPQVQNITTSIANSYITLPNTTTMTAGGFPFIIANNSVNTVLIKNFLGDIINELMPTSTGLFIISGTTTNSWNCASNLRSTGSYVPNPGVKSVFNTAYTTDISVTQLDATHALVCYQDYGNNHGMAQVLTISGTTVTAGTETVFNSATTYYISVIQIDATHALVCYNDGGNGSRGTAQVLTISGTTVTAGTETVFNNTSTTYVSVTQLDATHALVCYRDDGNSYYGTAQILTISGTTVTAGTETVFNNAITSYISVIQLDATHALVCYRDAGNSYYGTAQVLTISGTTVTAGTETVFNAATTYYISVTQLDATHALVCYQDGGNSQYGTACVLTISGTTVTAGTETVFNAATTYYISVIQIDATHALVCYNDGGNSNYGTAQVLTISGTTVTAGTETVFNTAGTYYNSVTQLDATHALVCYRDDGNSSYGTACTL